MVHTEVQNQCSVVAQTAWLSASPTETDIYPEGQRDKNATPWNPLYGRQGSAGAVPARSGAGRRNYGGPEFVWVPVRRVHGRRNRTMLPGIGKSRFCNVDS